MKQAFLLSLVLLSQPLLAAPGLHNHGLLEACSRECPAAKTDGEVLQCVIDIRKGPEAKAFNSSGCANVHDKNQNSPEKARATKQPIKKSR